MPRTPVGVGGPTTSQLQSTQIQTRSSQATGHLPTHEELIEKNQDSMALMVQAQEFLEKQGYAHPDVQGEKASLSHTLLLLDHCTLLSTLPKAIRAVATILEDEEARHTVDTIIAAIM